MAIPTPFLQELLARADIVDIVGRHVQLKKGGANFSGLCPFHTEKSPSFTVSPTKQFFHCFGCGKSGNAIGFLMEHLGMNFRDAVQDLAQQYGLQVPEEDISPAEKLRQSQAREQQSSLSDVLEKAALAFAAQLKDSPRAVDYLKGRGLSGQIAKAFGLGYAPPGWRFLAGVFPDYADAKLVDSGLLIAAEEDGNEQGKRYDRFRDRVMFPIRNVKGECIGFGGRVMGDEKPKYLNSPETPVFSKGRELYGLFEARAALRERGYALVTEGYMDVVALAQHGFANAVATLGTACTTDHVQKLFRFTDAVVFSFDGDAAGRRAARKALDAALPYASDTRSIKFLFLPAEHDPDSFIRELGSDAFAQRVQQALPLSRFLIEAASQDCEMDSAEGRARMGSQARALWEALPDGALKRQLLAEIADLVHIDSRELLQIWQPARSNSKVGSRKSNGPMSAPEGAERMPTSASIGPMGRGAAPLLPGQGQASGKLRRLPGRIQPASREDRVLRMLLTEPSWWDRLSDGEHALLCALPAPHGPLFAWLEGQIHEHGVQPWAALREGLREHPQERYATEQLAQIPEGIEPSWDETRPVLDELVKRGRQQEMDDLARRAATDPQALARLRELAAAMRAS
ncbi:MAG: DNA primase [Betaproteobacteria bacterium]